MYKNIKNKINWPYWVVYIVFIFVFYPSFYSYADDSICASVKIEINQELTLERQAFDAHMRINNGLSHITLEDVNIDVSFSDEDGNAILASSDPDNTDAVFFIRVDSMDNISDIDGLGRVEPSSSADIHWLIIPAPGASNGFETGTLYYVGAELTYTIGGEEHVTTVSPDYIYVKPMPELVLDYFLPTDVYGDDAFTPEIEPAIPFSLGVRVKNTGAGTARQLKIDSAQPKIVENTQGLLINFVIEGSQVNGQAAMPTLTADFGDIAPDTSGTARWIMSCSLSGQFTDFDASYSHSDELGGELTSLIENINTHFLVRDVMVDLPGRDSIADFLAKDGGVLRVYESENTDTEVTDQSGASSLVFVSEDGTDAEYALTAPVTAGFMYVQAADPFNGEKLIREVVRSDGKIIKPENAWLSKTRGEENQWQYFFNLFDSATKARYRIVFEDVSSQPRAPVIQFIPDRNGVEGQQISFIVEASDPDGTIPELTTGNLPAGAQFTDLTDGTGIFEWTPIEGQAGRYIIEVIASDGTLESSRSFALTICPAADSDCDGMDDQWELDHFGTLDRDGTGDYDGDGITDLDEFLNGTDPAGLSISLAKGFNLISIPGDVLSLPDLNDWMPVIGNAGDIEKVLGYDKTAGQYITLIPESLENPVYHLEFGEGVIVYARLDRNIAFESVVCNGIDLTQGFNITGFACAPENYSAHQFLAQVGSLNISNIQRFKPVTGTFETAGFDTNGNITGPDFAIEPGDGYFVNMKQVVNDFTP